jgi:DNA-binding response OmpR family regulator
MRVLIVEDDVKLAGLIQQALREQGMLADAAGDGEDALLEGAWDMAYENRSNVVDVYVRYLREKIDRPFGVRTIETVRGAGYRLQAPGQQLRPRAGPGAPAGDRR